MTRTGSRRQLFPMTCETRVKTNNPRASRCTCYKHTQDTLQRTVANSLVSQMLQVKEITLRWFLLKPRDSPATPLCVIRTITVYKLINIQHCIAICLVYPPQTASSENHRLTSNRRGWGCGTVPRRVVSLGRDGCFQK